MDNERIKREIGSNIAAYRRKNHMTQAELAERLNYSDKAVSKWERGESIPDVITLVQLAKLFCIRVDDLVTDAVAQETPGETKPVKEHKHQGNKRVVQMLVSLLVWFVALFVYVVLSSVDVPKSWIGFFYAVPANAIVLLSLRSAWRMYSWNFALVSLIVWGCLLSFYATMLVFTGFNIWKLFLLGILGQGAVCLWFQLQRKPKEEHHG